MIIRPKDSLNINYCSVKTLSALNLRIKIVLKIGYSML